MEETAPTETATALPSTAEAGGGVMAEPAETAQVRPPGIQGGAAEMQSQAAEEPPLPKTEAEAPSDERITQVAQEPEELPPAAAEAVEIPADVQDISAEREPEGDIRPVAPTEYMQLQATSNIAAPEQPAAEELAVATHDPEPAATAAASVEMLDPVNDSNLKPASLSFQSEETIRAYLDNTVVPVLRDGLRMLVKERPEDPCNYLVDFIKAHHP